MNRTQLLAGLAQVKGLTLTMTNEAVEVAATESKIVQISGACTNAGIKIDQRLYGKKSRVIIFVPEEEGTPKLVINERSNVPEREVSPFFRKGEGLPSERSKVLNMIGKTVKITVSMEVQVTDGGVKPASDVSVSFGNLNWVVPPSDAVSTSMATGLARIRSGEVDPRGKLPMSGTATTDLNGMADLGDFTYGWSHVMKEWSRLSAQTRAKCNSAWHREVLEVRIASIVEAERKGYTVPVELVKP